MRVYFEEQSLKKIDSKEATAYNEYAVAILLLLICASYFYY